MHLNSEEFTDKAWNSILSAQRIAQDHKQQQIESEHLLIALIEEEGLAREILKTAGSKLPEVQEILQTHIKTKPKIFGFDTVILFILSRTLFTPIVILGSLDVGYDF